MESTRDLILKFLQNKHTATATELSRVLQLTRADVRYHLNELLESKLIEKGALQCSKQKGRPSQLFRIAHQQLPENYPSLAEGLLDILVSSIVRQESLDLLAEYFSNQIPHAKLQTQKLSRLVAYLGEHGYMARWEAYTSGPRILFRNCPYAQILAGHPELCSLDEKIISIYLGQSFEQTARIDMDYARIPACIFTLKNQSQ